MASEGRTGWRPARRRHARPRADEPARLNQVKAVERGVDQLYNYIAQLASFGLELADKYSAASSLGVGLGGG